MDGYYYVQAWTAQVGSSRSPHVWLTVAALLPVFGERPKARDYRLHLQFSIDVELRGIQSRCSREIRRQGYGGYALNERLTCFKGLYDTLSSELEPHGIKVLLFQVSGQFGGGFDVEQNAKPEITRLLDRENGYVRLNEAVEAPKILNGRSLQNGPLN
jgi:hypothetical protein